MRKIYLILLLILIFHGVNNYIVLHMDNTFPTYDELDRFRESIETRSFFKNLNNKNISFSRIYQFYRNLGISRPPLYGLTLSLLQPFGLDADIATMVNMLYFFILLFSVFGIGMVLYDKFTGILAAFFISMFPGIFAMSRVLMVDFALTAMVSLSLYLLLLTDNFRKRGYCLSFGLSLGLGLLIKVPYLIFVIPTFIYYSFISIIKFFKQSRLLKSIILNICISLATGLLISGTWYLPNIHIIFQRAKAMSLTIDSRHSLFYYPLVLFHNHLYPFFCLLFLLCLWIYFKKRKNILLILWLLVPFLFVSFSPNKNPRFILPILPAIALVIATVVSSLRKAIIQIIITFTLFLYFCISYIPIVNTVFNIYFKYNGPYYSEFRVHHGIFSALKTKDWKIEEIINLIVSNKKSRYPEVLFICDIGEIHCVVDYIAYKRDMPIQIECPAQKDIFESDSLNTYPPILNFDFVITKSKYRGNSRGHIDWIGILSRDLEENRDKFRLVGVVEGLPDSSSIFIFQNKCLEN